MNYKKVIVLISIFFLLCPIVFAKTQKEEYSHDELYSQEYFDYLIEKANNDSIKQKTEKNEPEKEIVLQQDPPIEEEFEPFKLKIIKDVNVSPFSESFKVVNTKTIIPVLSNVNVIHNTSKNRNKYNSHDYKILAGAEAGFGRFFTLTGGLETNYRGLDQNPASKKLYITPVLNISNAISFKFHNKINVHSHTTDSDIELNISPFKSKALDFGIYAATSRTPSGTHSESINFSTTFYFF